MLDSRDDGADSHSGSIGDIYWSYIRVMLGYFGVILGYIGVVLGYIGAT